MAGSSYYSAIFDVVLVILRSVTTPVNRAWREPQPKRQSSKRCSRLSDEIISWISGSNACRRTRTAASCACRLFKNMFGSRLIPEVEGGRGMSWHRFVTAHSFINQLYPLTFLRKASSFVSTGSVSIQIWFWFKLCRIQPSSWHHCLVF